MSDYTKKIVYLSQEQYETLKSNGTITINGTTVTYNENDLYVTPQADPVTDIQINSSSIVNNNIADIPYGGRTIAGVIKVGEGLTLGTDGLVHTWKADDSQIKAGAASYRVITPGIQHTSVFYGLAKVAGADMASSSNVVGTYTSQAKGAIQKMLGVTDLFGNEENDITANKAYAIGEVFTSNGKLYRATAAIAQDGAIVTDGTGVNCAEINIANDYVKKTDYASSTVAGAVKIGAQIQISNDGVISPVPASSSDIKNGTNYLTLVPARQHTAVFYGLAKAAGADMASSSNAVGTYTDAAKAAIRTMIGAIGNTNYATSSTGGVVKIDNTRGIKILNDGTLAIEPAGGAIKKGELDTYPITPKYQHAATFFGLAKIAGADMANDDTVSVNNLVYTDAVKTAIRTMIGAIGNTNYATSSTGGVVKVTLDNGVTVNNEGQLQIARATPDLIKAGSNMLRPVTSLNVHQAAFYGLSKAAGVDLANETVTLGTYPATAQAAIQSMLGVDIGIIEELILSTTPSITAVANTRYLCGEVSAISFTPSADGSCEVIFTSGSTAALLTVPNTVKWPEWFNATTLETNRIYDIIITNGVYGAVMSWPS